MFKGSAFQSQIFDTRYKLTAEAKGSLLSQKQYGIIQYAYYTWF